MIHAHFHDEPLAYDGTQLRSHFAYDSFGILGDSIVAFAGPCEVRGSALVDLEDRRQNLFIFSENMLHFIVEHFGLGLLHAVARQRLLVQLIIAELQDALPAVKFIRRGDDIYDDTFKLSVSIATRSPVSALIHTGINIEARGAPVPARGLSDYGLSPQAVARGVMNRYREEIEDMIKATAKVRAVP